MTQPVNNRIASRIAGANGFEQLKDITKNLQLDETGTASGRKFTSQDAGDSVSINTVLEKFMELTKNDSLFQGNPDAAEIATKILLLNNKEKPDPSIGTKFRQFFGAALFALKHFKTRDSVLQDYVNKINFQNLKLADQTQKMKENLLNSGTKFHMRTPKNSENLEPDIKKYTDHIISLFFEDKDFANIDIDKSVYGHCDIDSFLNELNKLKLNIPEEKMDKFYQLVAHLLLNHEKGGRYITNENGNYNFKTTTASLIISEEERPKILHQMTTIAKDK